MPRYDYRCEDCEVEFEVQQAITDDPLTECPECGGNIYRVISPNVGITFKGDGFHVTDYKGSVSGVNQDKADKTPSSSCKNKSCANASECPAAQE